MKPTTALIFFGLFLVGVIAKPKISVRITNGFEATRTQFPYQVYLEFFRDNVTYWCGGSLISHQWILSAAHCINIGLTGVDVVLGAWNRSDHTEIGQQRISVPKINTIVHEDYNRTMIRNDIGLIKLPKPIKYNEYIQPIALPKRHTPYPTYADEFAITSGWGQLSDARKDSPMILHWVEVPIMNQSVCEAFESFKGYVQDTNICTETVGGKSACFGDSGGPLVLVNEKSVQIGINSFVDTDGCEIGSPAVFTRVTSYLDWIKKHTGI